MPSNPVAFPQPAAGYVRLFDNQTGCNSPIDNLAYSILDIVAFPTCFGIRIAQRFELL